MENFTELYLRPQPRLVDEMLIAVLVKGVNFGKGCKQGNTNKEEYLKSKRKTRDSFSPKVRVIEK